MGLNINGSWVDTRNGTVHFSTANDIDRVFFNNVKVWEKIRSLPDITVTSTNQPYHVEVTTDAYAVADGDYFKALPNTTIGGPVNFWSMYVNVDNSGSIQLKINDTAYYGASAHLKVEADLYQGHMPNGFGWCSANARPVTNDLLLDDFNSVVGNSGNVNFETSFYNTERYLCVVTDGSGYVLDPDGNMLTDPGLEALDLYYCRLKLTFSFEKDGMTASGSVLLENGTLDTDNFTVTINHTN